MKNIQELHENISESLDEAAERIMREFALRWFGFGLGVGIVICSIFYGIFNLIINK